MSNKYCETNPDLIKSLQSHVDKIVSKEKCEYDKIYSEILSNKQNMKEVLFTLNKCLDTSNLNLYIGNKRKIDIEHFKDSVNNLKRMKGEVSNYLDWNHLTHDKFIEVLNEVAEEILGITYHKHYSWDVFHNGYFMWDNETIAEYVKYDGKDLCWNLFKTPLLVFTIFLFPVVLLCVLLSFIIHLIENRKHMKYNLTCRQL